MMESSLAGWECVFTDDRVAPLALVRTFEFQDFSQAFAFMTRAAMEAEKLNHHPEWSNVYSTVKVSLSTHDVGNQVTSKDVSLALKMSSFALGE